MFHRKDREKWKVTLDLDDFMELYKEYYSGRKLIENGYQMKLNKAEDGYFEFERLEVSQNDV